MSGTGGRRGKRKPKAKRGAKGFSLGDYKFEVFLGVVFGVIVAATWVLVYDKRIDQGTDYVEAPKYEKVRQEDEIMETDEVSESGGGTAALAPAFKRPDFQRELKPAISIIIDDLGADTQVAELLLKLDTPIAFAILPHQKHSKAVALTARKQGMVVMLHLPMEPKNGAAYKPGPGVLLLNDRPEKIIETIRGDLETVPGVEGINNHMGSLFTENRQRMGVVMGEISSRGMFFIDSRTSPETVGYDTAMEHGVPAAQRKVFLDNERDVDKIVEQLLELARHALKTKSAIGIGHPYPETVKALGKAIPKVREMGVEIVPVTALLRSGGG